MSERDYQPPALCERCHARLEPGVRHDCNEEPPQDQLTIEAFPEWDGVGPVPYDRIPF